MNTTELKKLAEAYADAVAAHRLESLYGTSKSYTLEKARERDEAHEALVAAIEAQGVPDGWQLVPKDPTEALLRPFYGCPPEELPLAWQAMHMVASAMHRKQGASAPPAPQASVVQQEPVAWLHECRKKPSLREVSLKKTEPSLAAKGYAARPLVFGDTHPAQQAKPLSDEQIQAIVNDTIGIAFKGLSEFARAIEAAHGITKE